MAQTRRLPLLLRPRARARSIHDRRFRLALMRERLYWFSLVAFLLFAPSILCMLILLAQHVPLPRMFY
ncbi:hypothetical protein [Kushneria phosphatilytica]|uniref:Uncharacterized protein n=1 Tax=Kushneria phosphatilytica TaxID=657387 RepID=A0A1S1P0J5_9GAMM|nr:hypothetical protein [Kushneria phosphatilytica]OHV12958.1 hypothetical protein BH688_02855 [Kushneria phosphatilytica]QEL10826.1 hypothetical protein FY550_06620 [Kushneria phosphatilytica]